MVFENELLARDVWVWGARNVGPIIANLLMGSGGSIIGFIDNSAEIQGKKVLGKPVWKPDEIYGKIRKEDIVLCCLTAPNNASIIKQLNEHGIFKNVIEWDPVKYVKHGGFQESLAYFLEEGYEDRIVSKCCCQVDFEQEYFKRIASELARDDRHRFNRKLWEFVYIVHALEENGMLADGRKGLGFAVGEEPLPSYFAAKGVSVLATDLSIESETAALWAQTGQNALGDISKLFNPNIVTKAKFDENVTYMDLDMNHIPDDIGQFDFCWSSCAIEHVGSLELSKQFLKNMIKVLKPRGIAVHTTEFNISSDEETIETGSSVMYRRKDFEEIQEWMNDNNCEITLSFKRTQKEADMYVPIPPYPGGDERNHLNLIIDRFVCTSYALLIKKR